MRKDVVRFYMTYPARDVDRPFAAPPVNWRPVNDSNRCLSFDDFAEAERSLKWVIGNAWSSGAVWKYLGKAFSKGFYVIPNTLLQRAAVIADMDHLADRVPKIPPARCVCVAIAFYPDPDWHLQEVAHDPGEPPPLVRDIRVFVGTHGCGPDGPRFGDLVEQEDENLVNGSVLGMAALSAVG